MNLNDLDRLILRNAFYRSMKPKELARMKVAPIGLLSRRPGQGNVSCNGNAVAEVSLLLANRANGVRLRPMVQRREAPFPS
jgi:hypothetical protein